MEVRREFFSFLGAGTLAIGLMLTACGRKGPQSPSLELPQQSGSETNAPQRLSSTPPGETDPSPSRVLTPPKPVGPSEPLPKALEGEARWISPQADLPLVPGRIDLRDLKLTGPAREVFKGKEYQILCDENVRADDSTIVMKAPSGLLLARTPGQGDSLRRDFEYVFLQCQREE